MSSKTPFRFSDFLKVIRWNNLLVLVFTQYMTAIFLAGPKTDWLIYLSDYRLLLLVVSTSLIAAAGYIINDYYDVKIDYINKPERVVIGKSMKRRYAIILHTVFNFVAIGLGIIVSPWLGLIQFGCAFLLWFYSNQLKRLALIGNISIAFLTAISIFIVALIYPENSDLIHIYALFAFFITIIREVIKDIEDLKGDSTFGCKTLPIIWGIRKTKQFLYVFILAFVPFLFYLALAMANQYLLIYFVFLAILFLIFVYLLIQADTKKSFGNLSLFCKWIMISGVLSMIFF